jgi:hypothetical protein
MNRISILLARLRRDDRGQVTEYLLLIAAGAVAVGAIAAPALNRSAQTASKTFEKQVAVLEHGAGGGGGGWELSVDIGKGGVSVSGGTGSTQSSAGGVSGSSTRNNGGGGVITPAGEIEIPSGPLGR